MVMVAANLQRPSSCDSASPQATISQSTLTDLRLDQPYPLLRLFVRYILPGIVSFLVISAALTVWGARQLAQGVYLDQATKRAKVIDRAMSEVAPDAWRRLKSGETPNYEARIHPSGGSLTHNHLVETKFGERGKQ